MGEVYKARDTRLERTVAIKVLPQRLSASPEVRQRFEREAKTISQLSHPHICALYDVGNQDGVEYLVMEYLEGETLADRLVKGPLPLEQVLRCGIETADALDKAHRQRIVHRDLKPGNVMLTKSGVKLLDFGLAKAWAPVSSASSLTALPTQAPALTAEGTLLGTLQYMAPEQLEGKEADARTDVFALGTVLYEMATGRKAFSGGSQASLISAIMSSEPPSLSTHQPMSPPALDRIVRTCLAKDPEDRWQTARDMALQLRWLLEAGSHPEIAPRPVARRGLRQAIPWAIAGLCLALLLFAIFLASRRQAEQPRTVRAFIPPPGKSVFHFAGEANSGPVTVSPDGRRLAFVAADQDGRTQLWVRPLDALEAFPIPRTESASFPFWSPDGRFLGFFANGKLRTVEASDSPAPPRVLADVFEGRGGSWSINGTILYSHGYSHRGLLYRVSSSGGKSAAATTLDEKGGEQGHCWPLFLPDGRRFLYNVRFADAARNAIYAGSLDSDEKTFVLRADSNMAFAAGYLLFRQGERLLAARLDARTLAIAGEPLPVAERVEYFAPTGGSIFSASGSVLAYSAQGEGWLSRLVWLDRTGKELGTVGPPANNFSGRLSPDGTRVALSLMDARSSAKPQLWIYETSRGTGTQLTYGDWVNVWAVWSPDGGRLVFASSRKGKWDLYEIGLRDREERVLLESGNSKLPNGFSRDGRFLLYEEIDPQTNRDIKVLPLTGDRRPRALVATPFDERSAQFSPDGRFVAYVSDEPGRNEVYLAAFPEGARRRVSTEGGSQPRWSADGRELFYIAPGRKLTAVTVDTRGAEPVLGQARTLFQMPPLARGGTAFGVPTKYDVSPDGRFLVHARLAEEAPVPITLVLNWTAGLGGR